MSHRTEPSSANEYAANVLEDIEANDYAVIQDADTHCEPGHWPTLTVEVVLHDTEQTRESDGGDSEADE